MSDLPGGNAGQLQLIMFGGADSGLFLWNDVWLGGAFEVESVEQGCAGCVAESQLIYSDFDLVEGGVGCADNTTCASALECCALCKALEGCVAWSWNASRCFPKSFRGAATAEWTAVSGYFPQPTTGSITTASSISGSSTTESSSGTSSTTQSSRGAPIVAQDSDFSPAIYAVIPAAVVLGIVAAVVSIYVIQRIGRRPVGERDFSHLSEESVGGTGGEMPSVEAARASSLRHIT
eukprot:TRINITY_DN1258_c0_g1_i2.p1 TRINITY_DN1258_c0_g1~~TRINITY_DN1258_c0_g1_i2.p1  ORF type:complete len:235 (-),score=32.97 TRINITY_DN1258_c0_g1_i2:38-742(-)